MFFLSQNRTLDLESGMQNMCPVLDHLITRHNDSEQICGVWWRVGWMEGLGLAVVGGWWWGGGLVCGRGQSTIHMNAKTQQNIVFH